MSILKIATSLPGTGRTMNDSFKDCPGTAALLWGPRAQADGFTADSAASQSPVVSAGHTHPRERGQMTPMPTETLYAGFFMSNHFHLILIKHVIQAGTITPCRQIQCGKDRPQAMQACQVQRPFPCPTAVASRVTQSSRAEAQAPGCAPQPQPR